ncbi:MAG: glycosyltransferase family 4 protein [Chloroflexota bacterium]
MNIVFDVRPATPHFPGIGRYVRNLGESLPALLADGEQLILLHNTTQTESWLHGKRQKIASTASPFSLAQQWQIPPLLQRERAEIYHSPYYLMPYRPHAPTVLTVYDAIPIRYPETVNRRVRMLYRLTSILALRAAQAVIAISEATRADFIQAFGVPAAKIRTIPLAAEPHFRPQPAAEIRRVRQKYALPETFALYFGINKPHKNLLRLVQAWMNVQPAGWALAIGGAWDAHYPQAKERAAGSGSIQFLGPIPETDLPGLYAAASLFVFPSLYEGFGLPVLEAMACGTPVACAETSSLPEVGGEAVLYFDPENVEAICEALQKATIDMALRQALSERGLAQAQGFTWQRTAQETLETYRTFKAATVNFCKTG